jgi:hypothetical protein
MLLQSQWFIWTSSDTLLAILNELGVAAVTEARYRRYGDEKQSRPQTDANERRRRYCKRNDYGCNRVRTVGGGESSTQ